jgi:hypothetical protein
MLIDIHLCERIQSIERGKESDVNPQILWQRVWWHCHHDLFG